MPLRQAYLFVLFLAGMTVAAFWPSYFSNLKDASPAWHIHALTASLWLILLAWQSWSAHQRHLLRFHRLAGWGSLFLFPFFLMGSVLVVQAMAIQTIASDPFHDLFGARLGIHDTMATIAFGTLFFLAIRYRRDVHLHARYMLAAPLFLLFPVFARLERMATEPLGWDAPLSVQFPVRYHLCNTLAMALAALLYRSDPSRGRPFLMALAFMFAQSVAFETLGRSRFWHMIFLAIGITDPIAVATIGLFIGTLIAWYAWQPRLPKRLATRKRQ